MGGDGTINGMQPLSRHLPVVLAPKTIDNDLGLNYLDEANALADRVIVIDHGVIRAEDTPEGIRALVPGKKITFHWRGVTAADLAGLPVEGLALDGPRVAFLTSHAEDVLRALFGRGAPITDLEVAGAGLEEAVLVLTGGR